MENKSTSWIFIRGFARQKSHWYDFEDDFREFFPDVEIEFLDFPGNGEFWQEKSCTRIDANTEWLRMHSKLISQQKRPFILSISLGSMIAVDWAYRYPEELQGVVCINTSLREQSPLFQRLRPRSYAKILKILSQRISAFEREKLILEMTSNRRTGLNDLTRKAVDITNERPTSYLNASRQLMAAARFNAPKTRAKRPFLFLNSLRDDFVDPKCTASASRVVGGDLLTHPTAGHDLPLDDGPWVAERVYEWVDSLTAM